jgi:glyoxylase-like metal-dependent hydrolase (beta-lactamase superfamily II)
MTYFTRRSVLIDAAALGGAALVPLAPTSTRAAAPAADKQTPGVYRYKVGTHEITVLTDGANAFPLTESYVVNAPIAEVKKAAAEAYIPADKMVHHYAPIVVNTGSKLILIDTGYGPQFLAQSKGALGQLAPNLAAAGINPKQIDLVVISHFHADHVNGLLDGDNKPAFPNAEIVVPETEWKFWMDDGEMSRASKGRMEDLFENNRRVFDALGRKVTPYVWDKELVSGLMPVATVGHSIGHTSYILSSGSAKLYIQSDVTNNPDLFARHPDWGAFFDQDPNQAVAMRRKVYDMLVAEKMLVQGFHYPFPGLAHVEKADGGYRVVPMPWSPTI